MILERTNSKSKIQSRNIWRLTVGCTLFGLLAACGGGGGDTDGGQGVRPAPIPSPTPAPTPTPSGSGQVATVLEGSIPGVTAADTVSSFKVTNAGLYMDVIFADDSQPDAIVKLRGNPTMSSAWVTATPNNQPGAGVHDYVPSDAYSETRDGGRALSPNEALSQRWGRYTANTGGISITAQDSFIGHISLVAPGALGGVIAPRPWIVMHDGRGDTIYQDDGAYTNSNRISDVFGTAATPSISNTAGLILSPPENPELYVAAGDSLYLYNPTQRTGTWVMPSSVSGITDMVWADGTLYVGHGTKV